MKLTRTLVSAAILAALAGCGGGGGGEGSSSSAGSTPAQPNPQPGAQPKIGIFTDSAVSNLKYQSTDATGAVSFEGFTDQEGQFKYKPGDTIRFSVGDLVLGTTPGSDVVTPLELPAPVKISQILQSFDSDGDPDTAGISIPDDIHELLVDTNTAGEMVDQLKQSVETAYDENASQMLFTTVFDQIKTQVESRRPELVGKLKKVTKEEAKQHLEKNEHVRKDGGITAKLLERLQEWDHDEHSAKALFNVLKGSGEFANLMAHIDYQSAVEQNEDNFNITKAREEINKHNELFQWVIDADMYETLDTEPAQQALRTLLNDTWQAEEPQERKITLVPTLNGLSEAQVSELFIKGEDGWYQLEPTLTRMDTIAKLQEHHSTGQYTHEQVAALLSILFPELNFDVAYDYLSRVTIDGSYVNVTQTKDDLTPITEELNILQQIALGNVAAEDIKDLLDNAILLDQITLHNNVDYISIIQSGLIDNTLDLTQISRDVKAATDLFTFINDPENANRLGSEAGQQALAELLNKLGVNAPNFNNLTSEQVLSIVLESEGMFDAGLAKNRLSAYQKLQAYLTSSEQTPEKTRQFIQALIPDATFDFNFDYLSTIVVDGNYIKVDDTLARINAINDELAQLEAYARGDATPEEVNQFLSTAQLVSDVQIIDIVDYRQSLVDSATDGIFDPNLVKGNVQKTSQLFTFVKDQEAIEKLGQQAVQQSLAQAIVQHNIVAPDLTGFDVEHVQQLFVKQDTWFDLSRTLDLIAAYQDLQAYLANVEAHTMPLTKEKLAALFADGEFEYSFDYLPWLIRQAHMISLEQSFDNLVLVNNNLAVLTQAATGELSAAEINEQLSHLLLLDNVVLNQFVNFTEVVKAAYTDNQFDLTTLKQAIVQLNEAYSYFSDETKLESLDTPQGKADFAQALTDAGIQAPNLADLTTDNLFDLLITDEDGLIDTQKTQARINAYAGLQTYLGGSSKTPAQTKAHILAFLPEATFDYDADYLSAIVINGGYIDSEATLAEIANLNAELAQLEQYALGEPELADVYHYLENAKFLNGVETRNYVNYHLALKASVTDGVFIPSNVRENVSRTSELFSFFFDPTKRESLITSQGQDALAQSLARFDVIAPDFNGLTVNQIRALFVSEQYWMNEVLTTQRLDSYKALQDYLQVTDTHTNEMTKQHLTALFPENRFDFDQNYLQWLSATGSAIDFNESKHQLQQANSDLTLASKALQGLATEGELATMLSQTILFGDLVLHPNVNYLGALELGYANNQIDLSVMKQNLVKWNTLFDYLTSLKASLATPDGLAAFNTVLGNFDITPPDFSGQTPDQILGHLGKDQGYYSVEATKHWMSKYAQVVAYLDDVSQHNDRANASNVLAQVFRDRNFDFDANYHDMIVVVNGVIDLAATYDKVTSLLTILESYKDPEADPAVFWQGFELAGITNIDRNQDYRFQQLFDNGRYNLDFVQTMVETINQLAEFARKDAIWPSQLRFPQSVVSQANWSAEELQQMLLDAGFVIPTKKHNDQTIDHKVDLILTHKHNTLDIEQTQRSLNAIGASGVATLKVNTNPLINNNFYHFALRNDGSIVAWRTNIHSRDWEQQSLTVVEMNSDGPKAIEMFSTQRMGAAIREDGSVIVWDSYTPDGITTVPQGLDGTIPAVTIVSTENAFAAIRSNGSVVTFGTGDEVDISAYAEDLDGSVHKVVSLHATKDSFAALRENGSVVTWGNIDPADQDRLATKVPGHGPGRRELDRFMMVDAIYTTKGAFAGLVGDGSVITWGEVGVGADLGEKQMLLNGQVPVHSIAATEGAFAALRKDGYVVAWGDITKGAAAEFNRGDLPSWIWTDATKTEYQPWLKQAPYGDPNAPDGINWTEVYTQLVYVGATMPQNPAELEGGVISLHANKSGFTAIKADGKSQAWGSDLYFPESIQTALSAQEVSRVYGHEEIFVAEMADGSLLQWGKEFGVTDWRGDVHGKVLPSEQLNGSIKVVDVKIDSSTIIALREDGSVVQWGIRDFNLLPGYFIWGKEIPKIDLDPTLLDGSRPEKKVVEIFAANSTFGALHADGTVTTWGNALDNGNSLFAQRELSANMTATDYNFQHDADKDGVLSGAERLAGTSPYSRDTDGDGVDDGTEINDLASDPLSPRSPVLNAGNVAYDDKLLRRNGETLPASWIKH